MKKFILVSTFLLATQAMAAPGFFNPTDPRLPANLKTASDSQHEMSEGPILNFNGEVIGIHAGGKSIQTNQGVTRCSRGVRPRELFQES